MCQTLYLVFDLCFLFQFSQSPYEINGFILLYFTNGKKKRERETLDSFQSGNYWSFNPGFTWRMPDFEAYGSKC